MEDPSQVADSGPDSHTPDEDADADHCIICHLTHAFGFTPRLDVGVAPAERVDELPAVATDRAAAGDYPRPYWGRGPPVG